MQKSQTPTHTNLKELERSISYNFKDKKLLVQALTHRSCKSTPNNERLEFLGDAVLDLLVGHFLFEKFPKLNEGDLSKMRASMVNEKSFRKIADSINLGKYIFISQSEEKSQGRGKASILSDSFEALIGAIYLESGIERVRKIIYKLLEANYKKIDSTILSDYKTLLQEITQEKFGEIPTYELISESGPDHKKSFEIAIIFNGKEYARCVGSSKKDAQQKCAKIAYETLKQKQE